MAKSKANQKQTASNSPSHIVWFVPGRDNAPWVRIGAQWPTSKGTGYRQTLELIPNGDGNIVIMPFEPKDSAGEQS